MAEIPFLLYMILGDVKSAKNSLTESDKSPVLIADICLMREQQMDCR